MTAVTAVTAAASAHRSSDAPESRLHYAGDLPTIPRTPDPGTHGQAQRTIAAAFAAAPSLTARHEEAGEERMRLQALPEE